MDSVLIFKSGLDALMENFRIWPIRFLETVIGFFLKPYVLVAVFFIIAVFITMKLHKNH